MKVRAERTRERLDIDGVPVEAWRGRTASGVPCMLFVSAEHGPTLQDPAVTIESGEITEHGGVPCRRWTGRTESGLPFELLVHRITPERGSEAEFARELQAVPAPATVGGLDEVLGRELPVLHRTRSIDLWHVL